MDNLRNWYTIGFGIFAVSSVVIVVFLGYHYVKKEAKAEYDSKKIIEEKCEYYNTKVACEHKGPDNIFQRIIRGGPVSPGALPHMAFIIDTYRDRRCSGSLISENYVITAARCVIGFNVDIKLGSNNSKNDGSGKWFKGDEIHVHPTYHAKRFPDVALIKLNSPVQFSPYIRPLCVTGEPKNSSDDGTILTSGWGNDESGDPSESLQAIELTSRHNPGVSKRCKIIYDVVENDLNICAGYEGKGLKLPCKGDDGGPLQRKLTTKCPNTFNLIGIASDDVFKICVPVPYIGFVVGMYTKTDYVHRWIQETVWPQTK